MNMLWFITPLISGAAAAGSLWASTPADATDVMKQAFVVGNGKLGAMPFGEAGSEKLNLNIDSLWSGGPFESEDYVGGSPTESMVDVLEDVRQQNWQTGTTNDSALYGDTSNYGSFKVAGNLTISIDGVESASDFRRSLDLNTGVHNTVYTVEDRSFTTTVYCSYPDQVCVYQLESSVSLPDVSILVDNTITSSPLNKSCTEEYSLMTGLTNLENPVGMKWELVARTSGRGGVCNPESGQLTVPSSNATSLTIVIGGGTDYDQTKGTAADNYSFRGDDPHGKILEVTEAALGRSEAELRADHIEDYQSWQTLFTLDLPDTQNSGDSETSDLIRNYDADADAGDPYLEQLLFDYGRHMFISSSREENSLGPNLQGLWSNVDGAAWNGDYHANINLQMNLWPAEPTGLGPLTASIMNYMQDTWVPRGEETAKMLYGADQGWLTHDEMNIFGHTGMKAYQASVDYAIAPAWMAQHIWDRYEYSGDADWWKSQGWPMVKGHAQFWLSQLQEDQFLNDSTLVVNPCVSPEHGDTTYGCTHWQQLLHQLFEMCLAGAPPDDEDQEDDFLAAVRDRLARLDTGFHIGSWGNVKEWKVSSDIIDDYEGDRHKHMSHLVGWFPGWSLSSLLGGYHDDNEKTKEIQQAVETSLRSRGYPADSPGWAKVWRGALWARLNSSSEAHEGIRTAIGQTLAPNGLSFSESVEEGMADPGGDFQIDANFGLVGNVLSMLVVDLPLSSSAAEKDDTLRRVVLGPAIPSAWAGGSVRGLRIRGGGSVDFSWDDDGVVRTVEAADGLAQNVRLYNVLGEALGTTS